jgi:dTDP-4-amino-4,6-dideoxygalactose transaminase
MIKIAAPQIGPEEVQAVTQVLESGILAQGPRVRAFEEAFAEMCAVKYAIATSSGTTALQTTLLAHGIGPGDEVITSPFTFIASANSMLFTGARPVFVDIDPFTFNIDPSLFEASFYFQYRSIPVRSRHHTSHKSTHARPSLRSCLRYGAHSGYRQATRPAGH